MDYILIACGLVTAFIFAVLAVSARWRFIVKRVAMGDSFALARVRWHLICMERATQHALGRGMGHYKVPLAGGDALFPNTRDKVK